jgi:ATP-binding cassette subfamily B multidrug efflux pump
MSRAMTGARQRRVGLGMGHRGGPPLLLPSEKARNFQGTLKRLLKYLRPWQGQLVLVFLLAALSTVFSIASPKIMGLATTRLFTDLMLKMQGVPGAAVDFAYLLRILLVLAGLYIFSAFFSYLQQFIMANVAQRTVFDLRRDVDDKLSRLPLKFYDSHTHGDILSRVTNDVDNISSTLQQSITQIITAVVTLIGIVVMMLVISPVMALLVLGTLPLAYLAATRIMKRSQVYFAQQWQELGELNGHVEEMYTGHQIVKLFGREKESISKFNDINEKLYAANWKSQFMSGIIWPVMTVINNIGYVLVSVIGGIFVAQRAMQIGDVQAFIQYTRHFTHPITQVASIVNIVQSTVASAERVFELLDETEEIPDREETRVLRSPRGKVEFVQVKFGYKEDVPLIEDMNIAARPGQVIAIVGPTGAGKTTLVNLLLRFYEIDAGKITIDGVDIREMRRRDLRGLFGMVLQDTWLFNGTIRDNIAYGKEGATDEEIVRAAKAAHADRFIRTLPDGYQTVLSEEATNISQGQRQLLTIARAFLANPAILILDEATSSVDTRTEAAIQKAMANLRRGRTCFVIAHRLSTIRDADLILVMNHGRVVEQGTHKELLARNGFYADLYNSQFAGAGLEQAAG